MNPNTTLQTLIPDFQGVKKHIDRIIDVAPSGFTQHGNRPKTHKSRTYSSQI